MLWYRNDAGLRGSDMETIRLLVEGMKCSGCELSVKDTLEAVDGVEEVRADRGNDQVEIDFDPSMISLK